MTLESIMEGESEVITRKAIEMAKGGHMAAIRLVVDRLAPAGKERPIDFELPALNTPADAVTASAAIAAAVSAGDLTPLEATRLSSVVQTYVQALELFDIEKRVTKIEARQEQERANQTG
jgi:hypothetical protein